MVERELDAAQVEPLTGHQAPDRPVEESLERLRRQALLASTQHISGGNASKLPLARGPRRRLL